MLTALSAGIKCSNAAAPAPLVEKLIAVRLKQAFSG
jgi:hypothetical protein